MFFAMCVALERKLQSFDLIVSGRPILNAFLRFCVIFDDPSIEFIATPKTPSIHAMQFIVPLAIYGDIVKNCKISLY